MYTRNIITPFSFMDGKNISEITGGGYRAMRYAGTKKCGCSFDFRRHVRKEDAQLFSEYYWWDGGSWWWMLELEMRLVKRVHV